MDDAKETSATIGTKRLRDENSALAPAAAAASTVVCEERRAATQGGNQTLKKPRQEKPAAIATHLMYEAVAGGDDVDAEAELMRALEDAIEKDKAEAKNGAIPTAIDEDEDYDESD